LCINNPHSFFHSSLIVRWVTAAKSLVAGVCAIDMLAGPSEVLIIADATANPATVAADLLAQVCVWNSARVCTCNERVFMHVWVFSKEEKQH